jgi:hypothetical protein
MAGSFEYELEMNLRERGGCREWEVYVRMPKRGDERMMGNMMTSERRPFCSKRDQSEFVFYVEAEAGGAPPWGRRSFGGDLVRN